MSVRTPARAASVPSPFRACSPAVAGSAEPRDGWLVAKNLSKVSSSASDLLVARLQVLVVEDDELSLDIITRWLKRQGYSNVQAVCDGVAGLDACLQDSPDLLVLDQRIPGRSGLAIAEHLRMNLPREQRPWTVLFTAACNTTIMRLMATGNFDDLLRKPCIGEDYIGMITRARAGIRERRLAADISERRLALSQPHVAL